MITFEIKSYFKKLLLSCKDIDSIWLIGSRANNTNKEDSDWDFIVFANKKTLKSINNKSNFHHPLIDLLIVYDGNNFKVPWGSKDKSGSLSDWGWEKTSNDTAIYKSAKAKYNENGEEEFNVIVTECKAFKVHL